jgi:SAM-dependent methyltransferase
VNFAASQSHYPFDNAAPQAGDRFASLAALYDDVTRRHLDRFGIGAGWTCLEVGAGGGSVARFMSERVGPSGHVMATDINVDWMSGSLPANVEVRRHDIGVDPLPERAFDVVHARAVLMFVPHRRSALARMIAALKPGGWLLVEELVAPISDVFEPPDEPDAQLVRKCRRAIVELIRRRGGDPLFVRELPALADDAGLTEAGTEGYFVPFRTAAVVMLARASIDQLGAAIVEAGLMEPAELERFIALLDSPTGPYPVSMALISTWGRRQL